MNAAPVPAAEVPSGAGADAGLRAGAEEICDQLCAVVAGDFGFRVEMDRELRERRAMERDLRRAAERGEFVLAWQPIARTAGRGGVTGFEALLRWHHPGRGQVPPDLFIPAAEASGAIVPIGD